MNSGHRLVPDGTELETSVHTGFLLVSFALAFLGGYITVSLADQFRIAYALTPKFMSQQTVLALMSISVGGVAIWSMHFVGMGALTLKTPDGEVVKLYCDPFVTVMSLICAIVFVYIGIYFSAKGREYSKDRTRIFQMVLKDAQKMTMNQARSVFTVWRVALLKGIDNIIIGGLITAAGVCVMHYLGMNALSVDAEMKWDWGIVAASVLIAVVAATAAFWILFSALPLRPDMEILRVLAGVIAAVAVCGMHYTGSAAASYTYKYGNRHSTFGDDISMDTASWGAMVAGMGFLWLMVIFILTDLRAWHLTLDSIVTKTDDLMEEMSKGSLAPRNVAHQYSKFRQKLVERLPTDSRLNSSVVRDDSVISSVNRSGFGSNTNPSKVFCSITEAQLPNVPECVNEEAGSKPCSPRGGKHSTRSDTALRSDDTVVRAYDEDDAV